MNYLQTNRWQSPYAENAPMPVDPRNTVGDAGANLGIGGRRVNRLADMAMPTAAFTSPEQAMQARIARLTAQGYTGLQPGTAEFAAARAAGQHPILDWRRAQHPNRGGGGGGMGPYGGFIPQGYEPPHTGMAGQSYAAPAPRPMAPQGIAPGEGNNALASYGARRRPIPIARG